MRKINLSDFETIGDFLRFCDRTFSFTYGDRQPFLWIYPPPHENKILVCFLALLSKEELQIIEHPYLYRVITESEARNSPLWLRLEYYFRAKGRHITPLRQNVILMLEHTMPHMGNTEVLVVDHKDLLLPEYRTLILFGSTDFYTLMKYFKVYRQKIDRVILFPYPSIPSELSFIEQSFQNYYEFTLTSFGLERYLTVMQENVSRAAEIWSKRFTPETP